MAVEVDAGAETAAAEDGFDGDVACFAATGMVEARAFDLLATVYGGDVVAGQDGDVGSESGRRFGIGADVGDGYACACGGVVGSGVVDAVVAAADEDGFAGQDAVAVEVGLAGGEGHDARQVVVAEDKRAVDAAAGEQDLSCADFVQTLPRLVGVAGGRRQVVLFLFERLDVVVVVHGNGGATREDFEVGQGFEASEQRIKVGVRGLVVEAGLAFAQQPAAGFVLFIDEQGFEAGTGAGFGGKQAAESATNDQHIHVVMQVVVPFLVGATRRVAKAGQGADGVFVARPQALRPFEGFAVEAGRHVALCQATDEAFAAPYGAAARLQARVEFDLGRFLVGGGMAAVFELDEGVRFFATSGEDATRSPVFVALADDAHAVGNECGGEGVAGKSLVGFAVPAEADGLAGINADAGFVDAAGAHASSSRQARLASFRV